MIQKKINSRIKKEITLEEGKGKTTEFTVVIRKIGITGKELKSEV